MGEKGRFHDEAVEEYVLPQYVLGRWSREDKSACYQTADLFVFPSTTVLLGLLTSGMRHCAASA